MFTPRCHNCAAKMDAKTPTSACGFLPLMLLLSQAVLACHTRLCFVTMGWSQATADSILLLMVREKGRQENVLRHLFLSKYRAHFPREMKGKQKQQSKLMKQVFSLICHTAHTFMHSYSFVLWEAIPSRGVEAKARADP